MGLRRSVPVYPNQFSRRVLQTGIETPDFMAVKLKARIEANRIGGKLAQIISDSHQVNRDY